MLGDPGPYKCQQGQQSPCLFFKDGLSSPFVIVSRIRQVAVPLAPHLTPAPRATHFFWPSQLTSRCSLFLLSLSISPTPLSPASLSLKSSWQGSKENSYCANRGICDPTTGYCTCVTNYQTSNGYAQVGTHPPPRHHHQGEHGAYQDQIRTRCSRRRT